MTDLSCLICPSECLLLYFVFYRSTGRTYHFGKKGGASSNQFGSILERVKLDTDPVDWSAENLNYLMPTTYETTYLGIVRHSEHVTTVEEGREQQESSTTDQETETERR